MIKVYAPLRIDISGAFTDSEPFRKIYGGFTLNGAINKYVSATFDELDLKSSTNKLPKNSGLGASASLRAAYLVASNPSLLEDKDKLIEKVWKLENEILEQRAGFQDEASAVYGGVNWWFFQKNGLICRSPIPLNKAKHLEDRLVLLYTGETHVSSDKHELVFGHEVYQYNIPKLKEINNLANEMMKYVDDEKQMGNLMCETWDLLKQLYKGMETPIMKELQDSLKGNFIACKATGAGGGGCMIFYTKDKKRLINKISNLPNLPVKVIPFEFDYKGVRIDDKSSNL